jgi:hypothetical protein
MLELAYSAHTVLPDGGTLLAVLETRREKRVWFRTVEVSETVSYVHRAGAWWRGPELERVTDNAQILRLCELVIQAGIRESVDRAVG